VFGTIDIAADLGSRGIRFVAGDDGPAKIDNIYWLKKCAAYAEVLRATVSEARMVRYRWEAGSREEVLSGLVMSVGSGFRGTHLPVHGWRLGWRWTASGRGS